MAFKLKSGNKSPFKNMGSSPAKREFDDASGYNDAMRDFAEEMKPNQKKRFLEDSDVSPAKNQAILDAAADLKDDLKESPAKHGTTDDFLYGKNGHNPDTMEGKHEDWHTDKIEAEKKKPSPGKDMKTGKYKHSFESPAKQRKGTEGQDQDKIFNDKGEHVGDRDNQKSPYWYKIDGKKTTRAQYIKYKNVPGNMEGGGKQTNDPDVYGRKASNHDRGPKTK